ncbi:MAG: choice-of-anchor M domain-containing protein [Opitutales bacterium]|nr:choice-of-anchor M domain-containing protein [Opitutales bacterium]
MKKSTPKTFVLIATCLAIFSTALSAREIWKAGHIDIRVNYGEDGWVIDFHHEELGVRSTDEITLWVRGGESNFALGAQQPMPDNPDLAFIGAQAGDPFWLLPSSEVSWLVWPGFAIEDTDSHWFQSYVEPDPRVSNTSTQWVTVELLDVDFQGEGSGNLSMWQPGPNLFWSTHDEPESGNKYYLFRGAHSHMNWAFSQPGLYEIEIQASAIPADDPDSRIYSDPVRIQFYVDSGPQLTVTDDQVRYEFPVKPNLGQTSLLIEASEDLATWQALASITGDRDIEVFDPAADVQSIGDERVRLQMDAPEDSSRFFRLRLEE